VTLGDYAEPEPPAFDGFARASAKRSPNSSAAQHTAPERAATAKPYVPEPATRPLPPEVTGQIPVPRGGALGRGLRNLGRGRNSGPPVDLPIQDHAPLTSEPRSSQNRAESLISEPPSSQNRAQRNPLIPEPRSNQDRGPLASDPRSKEDRSPLVPEPRAVSAPLPDPKPVNPLRPLTPSGASIPSPKPASQPGPKPGPLPGFTESRPADPAAAGGRHSDPAIAPEPAPPGRHGEPAPESAPNGRRFGLKKRKDNNDYVDWVSGLGND
jgi:hypothetical protein